MGAGVNPLDRARRRVYMPYARIPPGRMVELPGRGSTYVTDTPGPAPGVPHDRAAARAGLHRAADLVPGDRATVAAVPRGHPGPALARAGHPERGVLAGRLRRRRGRADRRARARGGDRRRLLDGLDRGPAGLAPARATRIGGLVLCATTDRFQMTLGERFVLHRDGRRRCSGCAPSPGRGRRCTPRAPRPGPGPRAPRHRGVGTRGAPLHLAVGGRRRRIAALGRHHSRPWLGADRRPDRGRGQPQRPRHPAGPPARRGPRASPAPPSTTSTPAMPPACWRPRRSCRPSSRPWPPSTPVGATSAVGGTRPAELISRRPRRSRVSWQPSSRGAASPLDGLRDRR